MRLRVIRLTLALSLTLAAAPVWAHGINGPLALDDLREPTVAVVGPSAEPARAPDAAMPAHLTAAPRGRLAGGDGLAAAAGVLIAAAGLVGLTRGWRRDPRRAMATATAALVLGFVVETTPHLVHHSLDPDKGAGCQVLQTVERSQAALGTPDVVPAETPSRLVETPPRETAPTLAAPAAVGRAPPA